MSGSCCVLVELLILFVLTLPVASFVLIVRVCVVFWTSPLALYAVAVVLKMFTPSR